MLLRSEAEYISLEIYDAAYHPWDMMYVKFNAAATDGTDKDYDATKPSNPDLNFYSIASDNSKLSVDSRPYDSGKVIPLGFTSNYAQEFIIKAESIAAPANAQIYLHDKYLGKTLLMNQGTEYSFAITTDSASQGNNRFELRMGSQEDDNTTAAAKAINVSMTPNPATDEVTINFETLNNDQVGVSIMNLSGVVVMSQDLGVQQTGSDKISIADLAAGIYLVEFTSGNDKVVKRLVKE